MKTQLLMANRTKEVLGLSLLALQAGSHASIYHVDFPDVTAGPDPDEDFFNSVTASVQFDVVTPAISAILGHAQHVQFFALDNVGKKGKSFGSTIRSFSPAGTSQVSSGILAESASIGPATSWTPLGFDLPDSLTNQLVGVRLETSAGSGSFRYGWIRFSTGTNGIVTNVDLEGTQIASTVTVLEAAFETVPDLPIQAGAVPEASTNAAIAFAGLVGGAAAFRRLRKGSRSASIAG